MVTRSRLKRLAVMKRKSRLKRDFGRGFDTRVVVYVPSTEFDKKITASEFKKRIGDTTKFLTDEFGGVTVVSGSGSWHTDHKVIKENVMKVESFSPFKKYVTEQNKVRDFLREKAKEWKQHSLSFEFESPEKGYSTLYFVS
jgi:hypothetical protein